MEEAPVGDLAEPPRVMNDTVTEESSSGAAGASSSSSSGGATVSNGPAPIVKIFANGSEGDVPKGASNTLTWTAENADSCAVTSIGETTPNGSSTLTGVDASTTYTAACTGPGGTAYASVKILVNCATNQLADYPSRFVSGIQMPLFDCPANVTAVPAGAGCASWAGINNAGGGVMQTAPIATGLVPGATLRADGMSGELILRIYPDRTDNVALASCTSSAIFVQFTNDANVRIDVPGSSHGLVPYSALVANGVTVPAGATKLWGSYPDDTYWDAYPNRQPSASYNLTNKDGCRFRVQQLGCR